MKKAIQFKMFISVQTIVFVAFVAIMLSVDANASVHRLEITVPDNEPVVKERFSINGNGNNESVVSREVINHVRHKHEQTIGNIHIVTNIDIANLVTILNTSAPLAAPVIPTTTTTIKPGKRN